jgi:hypothetical protein
MPAGRRTARPLVAPFGATGDRGPGGGSPRAGTRWRRHARPWAATMANGERFSPELPYKDSNTTGARTGGLKHLPLRGVARHLGHRPLVCVIVPHAELTPTIVGETVAPQEGRGFLLESPRRWSPASGFGAISFLPPTFRVTTMRSPCTSIRSMR